MEGKNKYSDFWALSKINELSTTYKKIDANIWMGRGDHFFYNCEENEVSTLCEDESLKKFMPMPLTDTINLKLSTLNCSEPEPIANFTYFNEVCS